METFGFLHFKSKWTNPKDLHLTSSLFTLTSNFQIWVYRSDKPKFFMPFFVFSPLTNTPSGYII